MPYLGIALATVLACQLAHAGTVRNVKPEDLAGYVAKHDFVLVQFTSPDRRCPHCIGAARAFARAVAPITDRDLRFVRVQWEKFDQIPDLGTIQRPWGMPQHVVYRYGEAVGTVYVAPKDGAEFRDKLTDILQNPEKTPDPYFPNGVESKDKPAPMSADEEGLTRRMIRKDLINEAMATCRRMFPEVGDTVQPAYDAWVASQKPALDRAALIMLQRTGRDDAQAMAGLVEEEKQKMRTWSAARLDVPEDAQVSADSCVKIARNLDSLPEFAPLEDGAH